MGRKKRIKDARRAELERLAAEGQRLAQQRQTRRRFLLFGATLLAFVAVLGATFLARGGSESRSTSPGSSANAKLALAGQPVPILGRRHVPFGTKVAYNSSPPSSGPHWPKPADWGVYRSPLPDERAVHNLEHGGIWISYKGVDGETRQQLEALADKYPSAVVLSPRPRNDSKIALASWGRIEKLSSFDESRIVAFISANINKSPEPLASIEESAIAVGGVFPDFRFTEASGQVLTRASLRGKPSIVWFTTTYCVPCQIGARVVSRLDDELGGKAFSVLVVFVDPGETVSDLTSWRAQFGNPDWLVALDTDLALAEAVELRFLDSKFLLDKNGRIENIDFNIADERYLGLIRQAVEEAS